MRCRVAFVNGQPNLVVSQRKQQTSRVHYCFEKCAFFTLFTFPTFPIFPPFSELSLFTFSSLFPLWPLAQICAKFLWKKAQIRPPNKQRVAMFVFAPRGSGRNNDRPLMFPHTITNFPIKLVPFVRLVFVCRPKERSLLQSFDTKRATFERGGKVEEEKHRRRQTAKRPLTSIVSGGPPAAWFSPQTSSPSSQLGPQFVPPHFRRHANPSACSSMVARS